MSHQDMAVNGVVVNCLQTSLQRRIWHLGGEDWLLLEKIRKQQKKKEKDEVNFDNK